MRLRVFQGITTAEADLGKTSGLERDVLEEGAGDNRSHFTPGGLNGGTIGL